MIYFDNAASSWPKPEAVWKSMENALRNVAANPGRGEHRMAMEAARLLFSAREAAGRFFGAETEQIIFTLNATTALNQAIKGMLKPGDHAIASCMEHNSVLRPLRSLALAGLELTILPCDSDGILDPDDVSRAVKGNTRLIVLTHASNVTGAILPVLDVARIAQREGVCLLLDAAQGAGVLPIKVKDIPVDLMAFPGHKGLMGPQGTGGLYIRPGISLDPLIEGGTGNRSEMELQPDFMPDRYESGTPNTVGLAGLAEGIRFVEGVGVDGILNHERELCENFLYGVEKIQGIRVYGPRDVKKRTGVVSINIGSVSSSEVSFLLDRVYNIAVRSGLHCTPAAHSSLGTLQQGTVRFSFSYFNTHEEVHEAVAALAAIAGELG